MDTEERMTDTAVSYPGYGAKNYRAYVLGALLVVYTFNFIDRILLGVLQESIKHDLHVDDFQLGLLGGPAFAILYTLMGVPIARYAERHNRISIIAMGAAVWSLMTAACGFAGSFLQLAAARIGVGIGEAACTPPSHSVISDYFPASRRASALSIWALGIPIGTMMAAVGGGWLAQNMDWRAAFWLLGAPGLLVALGLRLTVREPPRSGPEITTPSFSETLATLTRKPSFWHIAIAGALMAFVGYSTAQFLVSYLVRNYGLGIAEASYAFGAIAGFAVAIGTFAGGFISDRLSHQYPRVYAWLPMLGVLIAAPLYLLAFYQTSFWAGFAILMVAPIFHYLYLGPGFAVVQSIAPPRMRATGTALLILIINLIGYGLGPPTMGALSDYFANADLAPAGLSVAACRLDAAAAACAPAIAHGLKTAMMCVVSILFWPALHFWLAGRTLLKDRVG
jgi:predicted MFS family arabinose efflux permease